jgi:alpha-mannosidase
VPEGLVRFDVASAVVRADSDQLEGTARNVIPVQSWVDVSNGERGVTVATPDAPLVEIGGLFAEQPWLRSLPRSQTLFSYVMNNYWHTNFKADQEGPVTFRYAIRPHGPWRAEDARLGEEVRRPLLVRPR